MVLASGLIADNEGSGAATRVLVLPGIAGSGLTLLSWVALRTAIFAGPVVGNNGNAHVQQFSQSYSPGFPQYSLRGYRCYSASGGSDHSVTVTKNSAAAEEMTVAVVALSRGAVVSSSVVNRTATGAGATHNSGNVTTTGPALLVAVGSGSGDVNATAPTQTWPADWTVHRSVARGTAQAPNGHVPLYVATKAVSAGTYSVNVQVVINEGIVLAIYAVQ